MNKQQFKTKLLAATASIALSMQASAGLISVIGGTAATTPAGNDIIPGGINGWYDGAALTLMADAEVTYTYMGHESGNHSEGYVPDFTFDTGWDRLFGADHPETTVGTSTTSDALAGLLAFSFKDCSRFTNACTGLDRSISNGESSSHVDFWVGEVAGSFGNAWWIGFNDTGSDNDYDDMVLQVSASIASVPEPGSLTLIGLGLAAMGFFRRQQA